MGLAPWAADLLGADDPSGRRCGNAMLHKDERGDAFTVHRTLQVQRGFSGPRASGCCRCYLAWKRVLRLVASTRVGLCAIPTGIPPRAHAETQPPHA
jgi:hypothetical protein